MNMNARCRTWLPCLFLLVCALFCTGQAAAYDSSNLTIPANATAITYGVSGKGRALMAYKFGSGKNVMVLGYEIHGFEDNYDRDGGALVYAAGQMMNQLSNNISLLDDYDWTVYVLPSMNPDGLLDGTTNNGPGRLTTTYLTSNGTLSSAHGIDMNRSFPTAWVKRTDARNYNGTYPLACRESAALAQFVQDVKGSGVNICFDVHGWFSQIITSNGKDNVLYKTLKSAFPYNTHASCRNGSGYFTAYTTTLGYISCLFEYPNVYSLSQFQSSGYCEKFNSSMFTILKSYGTYAPRVYTVTVRTQGSGSGTVTGGGAYAAGKTAILTAKPASGSAFSGWYDSSGKFLSGSANISFTVSGNTTLYAQFDGLYTGTARAEGGGTVTGGGSYASGAKVTLTALPADGYTFLGWYGQDGAKLSDSASYSFDVTGSTTITARFGANITLKTSRSGSASGGGAYAVGSQAILTAQPQEGRSFQGWYALDGTLLSQDMSYAYTVEKPQTLVAMFQGDVFYDLNATDWFLDSVLEAAERDMLKGVTPIRFDPSSNMTRAQVVTVLARMANADTASAPVCGFTDVDQSRYYAPAVNWAYENKIVQGMTETTFAPNAPITRQQLVTMVVRYLEEMKGLTLDSQELSFSDQNQIGNYARESVQKALAIGLIKGYTDGTFRPNVILTRREGVTVLVRLARYLDAIEAEKPTEPEQPSESPAPEPTPEQPATTEEPAESPAPEPSVTPAAPEASPTPSAAQPSAEPTPSQTPVPTVTPAAPEVSGSGKEG